MRDAACSLRLVADTGFLPFCVADSAGGSALKGVPRIISAYTNILARSVCLALQDGVDRCL